MAPHRRRLFWQVFLAGTALMLVWAGFAAADPEPALVSRLLVFGAFYVPVLFVFFMASEALVVQAPAVLLVEVFVATGLVANLEALILNTVLSPFGYVTVGPVEEAVKLGAVIWLLRGRAYPTIMDGILFGAAAGMGFAASENLSYFFSAYSGDGLRALLGAIQHGQVHTLAQATAAFQRAGFHSLFSIFALRSFFEPWMHGSWTAILAGVAWREARGGRLRLDLPLLGAFIAVAGLHSAWDMVSRPWEFILFPLIVGVDILALRWLIRAAHRQVVAPAPPQAEEAPLRCPACGTALDGSAHFCPACGRSVADAVRRRPTRAPGPALNA